MQLPQALVLMPFLKPASVRPPDTHKSRLCPVDADDYLCLLPGDAASCCLGKRVLTVNHSTGCEGKGHAFAVCFVRRAASAASVTDLGMMNMNRANHTCAPVFSIPNTYGIILNDCFYIPRSHGLAQPQALPCYAIAAPLRGPLSLPPGPSAKCHNSWLPTILVVAVNSYFGSVLQRKKSWCRRHRHVENPKLHQFEKKVISGSWNSSQMMKLFRT